jgi:integrase/recombinase XerD
MSERTDNHTLHCGDLNYWISEWFKGQKRRSANTQQAYRRDLNQFLARCGKPFDQIDVDDILGYQSALEGDPGCAERTVARKVATLRSFYRFLNSREVTSVNIDRIESASIPHEVNYDQLLTEKEVEAVIAGATDETHRALVRLLYLTAARISEALSLRWRDLTPLDEGGEAHITGKGRKRRNVFMPPALWNDLQELRGSAGDNDVLFPALDRSKALEICKKLGKAAKIDKNVTPHSFRHAHISHALKNGATVVEVRDQAGHSNLATTSLYAHVSGQKATATRLKIQ